jgi:3-oxoadipate enol-lactonase
MPVTITENTSIDYDISGKGPPLLLIGGLGFGRWGFFKQVPAFARHFRTITFDVRGERRLENGVSDLVEDVVALMDHLGLRKVHVLGTSLGGFVAQELALMRPDLVDHLVLVCTSYGGRGPESMSFQALADMMGWGSFDPEMVVRRGLETATSETYRAEHEDEFEQIVRWRLADAPSEAAYHEQARAGAGFDLSGDVGHITSPTLVIHGAEDRYVPVANAAALAGSIPDARLRVLDHAGHLVFVERSAEVNREVVSFLKPRRPRKPRTRVKRAEWPARIQGWLRGVSRSLGSRVRKNAGQHHLRSLAGHFRKSGKMGINKAAEYKRALQAARRNSLRRKTR